MSSYIASNDNRIYAAAETTLGEVPAITGTNRFPAVKLTAKQSSVRATRRDKTGTRSFTGTPAGTRRNTEYQVKTYLTSWTDQTKQPGYGPLFQAALGGTPLIHAGGTIASASDTTLTFQAAHGLTLGQAVAIGGEIRFVTAIPGPSAVEVNAPFSGSPAAGSVATPTVTYKAGKSLPTASIFDFWSPSTAIQRVLCGAAVDEFSTSINADFHEFAFKGPARDIIDSASFTSGEGSMTEFPAEPDTANFDVSVVPGHLGQAWLGSSPERFYTLTAADITVSNGLEKRTKEFGVEGLRAIVPGQRKVTVDFELFASDEEQAKSLYAAARQKSPIRVMFQLGQQERQLFGVYMKSVVPELPDFDDSDTRVAWKFRDSRAQGSNEDEIVIAFA